MTDPWTPPASSSEGPVSPPDLEPLEVRFHVDDARIPQVELAASLRKPRMRVLLAVSVLSVIVMIAERSDTTWFFPVLAAVLLFNAWWAPKKRIAGLREGQKRVVMRMTSAHFTTSDDESSSSLAWPSLSHFHERRDEFLIYQNASLFWVLPKRALTPDQAALARSWLGLQLPRRPRSPGRFALTAALWFLLVLMFWAIYQIITTPH